MLGRSSSRGPTHVPAYLWLALTLGSSLNPLNSSMVSVALVPIMRHFRISLGTTSWVVTSFYLAACVTLPIPSVFFPSNIQRSNVLRRKSLLHFHPFHPAASMNLIVSQ